MIEVPKKVETVLKASETLRKQGDDALVESLRDELDRVSKVRAPVRSFKWFGADSYYLTEGA